MSFMPIPSSRGSWRACAVAVPFLAPLLLNGPRLAAQDRAFDEAQLARVGAFLGRYCAPCHGAAVGSGGFALAEDLPALAVSPLVKPGQPEASVLWRRAVRDKDMPPAGEPQPSDAERAVLTAWIKAGAPGTLGPAAQSATLSPAKLQELAYKDILAIAPGKRLGVRYLSLAHWRDARRRPFGSWEATRAAVREGMAKLVNSLSWREKPAAPVPVEGSDGALLRLFLPDYARPARDTGFDRVGSFADFRERRTIGLDAFAWKRLADADPYRHAYAAAVPRDLSALAGTTAPIMRADVFAKLASGPFYYEIMGFPRNLHDLERALLGFSAAERVRRGFPILRLGFQRSGVSKQNRLIERHAVRLYKNADYWISYDFDPFRANETPLERFPVGPADALPFRSQKVFRQSGGEVIFTLPNGLQAYALTNAGGVMLEEAPREIVEDPKRGAIRNAVSCMDCHRGGLIRKDDELRDAVAREAATFTDVERRFVAWAHPAGPDAAAPAFQTGVDRVRGAMLAMGVTQDLTDRVDVTSALSDWLGNEAMDESAVASELGISVAFLRKAMAEGDSPLAPLRAPLAAGSVRRADFEAAFARLAAAGVLERWHFDARQAPATQKRYVCRAQVIGPAGLVDTLRVEGQVSLDDTLARAKELCAKQISYAADVLHCSVPRGSCQALN